MPKLNDFSLGKYSIGGSDPMPEVINLDGMTSGNVIVQTGSTGFKGSMMTIEANKKLISMSTKNVGDGASTYVGGAYGMGVAYALQDIDGNVWQLTSYTTLYLHLMSLSLDLITGNGYYLYRISTLSNNPTSSNVSAGAINNKPPGFNASNSYLLFGVMVVIPPTSTTTINYSGVFMTMKQL
ncbi:MAG TPA: hypothetical protein DEF35_09065 [Paenibacillus sp.]|uniref:hypothetical protein n=1 Tax=Paenibacillus TaxID=44249 RepID=UPI000BA17233|nr:MULTISPECIES: hypothetical protein [Paenibacillus]OZQ70682.1 hypothetical protein CA599_12375 [Paenibacillus taichungensis]HBU81775.1 hypothetical protein [Paenibacillus sp.]